MQLGIDGRVALVGGSSSGLGRAIADELAREGADLILCARGEPELLRAKDEIEQATGRMVLAVATDLSDPAQVDGLIAAGLREFATIDILVTNTGGPPAGRFEDHAPEAWQGAVRQNFDSVVNLVRGVLPGMQAQRWGRIVNVTSIAVKQPVENLILSNSVRAAVTGFARTLANEVGRDGVTVNNVMPGYTRTERLVHLAEHNAPKGGDAQDTYDRWAREIPLGRLGEPNELAALVAFLASERAGYITGQSIAVDGGWIKSIL